MDSLLEKHKNTIVVSLGTVATLTLLLNVVFKKNKNDSKLATVPYSWPFLGSTFQFYRDCNEFVKKNTAIYGEAFRLHIHGSITTVVGLQDVTEVFKNKEFSFVTSKLKFIGPQFLYPDRKPTISPGAIIETIKNNLIPNIDIYGPRSYNKLIEIIEMKDQETYIEEDLFPFVNDLVSRSVATSLLGSSLAQREDLIHAFKTCVGEITKEQKPSLTRLILPFVNTLYIRLFRPRSNSVTIHKKTIKNAVISEIERKKNLKQLGLQTEETYLMDYILETYPGEVNEDYLDSITFIILMLVFVGFDTTANATNYVLYQLMLHPEYIEELRQEQLDIFSSHPDQDFVLATSKKMVKLDSFIREALRFRMDSIGLAHTNIGNQEIRLPSGAVIPPGEEIYINLWKLHHTSIRDELYAKDMDEFRGFRYLDTDRITTQTGQDNLSFGLGRHACPGRWFAVHQIKGILSVLLRSYDMAPVSTIQPPIGRKTFSGAVKFTKRK